MKIEELMKAEVQTCHPNTDLATVAMLMWNYDCGAIPVVDDTGVPVGIITDRDIAMGSAFDSKPLREIQTQQVTNHRKLTTCNIDDDVQTAMSIMKKEQIHRLPVVNTDGFLQGIVSMDDLILKAQPKEMKSKTVSFDQVMSTLKSICAPVKQSHRVAMTR